MADSKQTPTSEGIPATVAAPKTKQTDAVEDNILRTAEEQLGTDLTKLQTE